MQSISAVRGPIIWRQKQDRQEIETSYTLKLIFQQLSAMMEIITIQHKLQRILLDAMDAKQNKNYKTQKNENSCTWTNNFILK